MEGMIAMNKEVRNVVKSLRGFANPKSSFNVVYGKHLKVRWNMPNDIGDQVKVLICVGKTPSDHRWRRNLRQSLRRTFRERNISEDVGSI